MQDISDRVKIIKHKGKEIVMIDLSNLGPDKQDELSEVIDRGAKEIRSREKHSIYTLTDVTNSTYDQNVGIQIADFTKKNRPYVKKAAVIGVKDQLAKLYNYVKDRTKRNFAMFDDIEEAKEWLTKDE